MKPLHISLNTNHSGCKPSTSISSFTHSYQVFLPLPTHLTPVTTTFLQAHTQSSPLLRSTCPNYLNLLRLTTSATLCTPRRLYKSTLHFLSFSDTPCISPSSVPSSPDYADLPSSSPRFQVSVPYVNALWTQALYIFPFMRYDAPRDVRIGDNSLNLAEAHLTLALAASSTPPTAPSVLPKKLGNTFQLHIGLNLNLFQQN